ncbi:MAG: GAF domain-containing protein [Chloroflexi bacterium]|nr:GAF domain-containing protein [Chloroflexota bacterium]
MKIKTQFIINTAIFSMILLIMSVSLLILSLHIDRLDLQEDIANRVEQYVSELGYLSNDYLLFHESQQRTRWEAKYASLSGELSGLNPDIPELQASVNNIRENQQRLKAVFSDAAAALESAPQNKTASTETVIQASWSRMAVQNQAMFFEALRLSQALHEEQDRMRETRKNLTFVLLGLFGVFLLTNYVLTFRHTLKSLAILQRGTRIVGSGNLEHRIGMTVKDEMGDMARSFDNMTEQLQMVTVSKDELQHEVEEHTKAEHRAIRQKAIQEASNRILREALTCETDEELGRACLMVSQEITGSKFGFIDEINAQGKLDDIAISDPGWELCRMTEPSGHGKLPADLEIHGLYGRVIRDGKSFFTNDPASHPDSIGVPQGHPSLTSFLGVPLIRENKTIGMVGLANKENGYSNEDMETVEALAPAIVQAMVWKRTEDKLRQSEERFAKAFHASPMALAITRLVDGCFVDVNDAYLHLFGYRRDEVIGHRATELNMYNDPEQRTGLVRRLREQGALRNFEMVRHTKTGQSMTILYSFEVINFNGQDHILASLIDITERKKSEQLKDEFIGMVSHELKTPLTVIIGALSTAKVVGLSEKDARELLDDAIEGANSLASIVENLLELSRSQAKRLELHREPADIAQIMWNVVRILHDKSVIHRLNIDVPADLPTIPADPLRIERVIFNLVENAIKYTPKGGNIRVFARQQDDNLVVCVSDQGPGISPTDQKRLFQSFEQLGIRPISSVQGVGLGLKVCRTLVKAHGGRIWVESEPGKGASFFFTLPITAQDSKVED